MAKWIVTAPHVHVIETRDVRGKVTREPVLIRASHDKPEIIELPDDQKPSQYLIDRGFWAPYVEREASVFAAGEGAAAPVVDHAPPATLAEVQTQKVQRASDRDVLNAKR